MDILLIEDRQERREYVISAVNNLKLDSINLNFAEELSVLISSSDQENCFNCLKQSIINLESQKLIVIADVNLGLSTRIVNQLRQEYSSYQVPVTNSTDSTKDFIGLMVLLIEVIKNRRIEKVLIILASTDVENLDTLNIRQHLPIITNKECRDSQVKFDTSNAHRLEDTNSYQALIQAAINKFRVEHKLPMYYAIKQLLIAHTIEETKLAHAGNSLNKDNLVLVQGESSSNKFIDKGTLFYELIDSNVQISDTCCKALFNCGKSEPIKIEVLKQIFIKFGYGMAISPNCQATQINFPLRNGMIFIAHLLRCLEHIRKHQNNIEILLELEKNAKSQAIKKTSFTVRLETFTLHDANRLKNGLDTYTGSQSGMLIKHLRELISCNTSIINDYKEDYSSQTYNLENIHQKIYPKSMSPGSHDTETTIFEKIIEYEFLEQPNRLKLSWKPPQ